MSLDEGVAMSADSDRDAWFEFRKERRTLLLAFVLFLTLGAIAWATDYLAGVRALNVALIVLALPALLLIALFAGGALRLLQNSCPNCGHEFYLSPSFSSYELLRSDCQHCGIDIGAPLQRPYIDHGLTDGEHEPADPLSETE